MFLHSIQKMNVNSGSLYLTMIAMTSEYLRMSYLESMWK